MADATSRLISRGGEIEERMRTIIFMAMKQSDNSHLDLILQ